jgi:hypothetical protein
MSTFALSYAGLGFCLGLTAAAEGEIVAAGAMFTAAIVVAAVATISLHDVLLLKTAGKE